MGRSVLSPPCYLIQSTASLRAVVISKLRYQYRIFLKFINDTMLVIYTARPITS